ncbi:hypothetical protein D3C87_1707750 [compost metagenome]
MLHAILFVLASLQLSGDQDSIAFVQPFGQKLGGLAEGRAAHPLGFLDLFPGLLILVAVIAGNAEARHRIPIR